MNQLREDLQTETTVDRTMLEIDLDAVMRINAEASGRRRPRYFELMLQRALQFAGAAGLPHRRRRRSDCRRSHWIAVH